MNQPIPKPKFDNKILERLDNAIAICDVPFVLHKGFVHFATTYFVRPHNTSLLVPKGVDEDLTKLATMDGLEPSKECLLAMAVFQILIENDYAELNGNFAQSQQSMHGQIMKMVDYLRTNHRVCVLSNSSRLLQSVQQLRKDHREHAKGISFVRLSDQTNKPMIARWYDPATYASSYVG